MNHYSRKTQITICISLGFVLSLSGSAAHAEDPPADLPIQARSVLRQYCHRCHSGPGSEGGEFDVLNPQTLINQEASGKKLIAPKKPGESYLLERVIEGSMPPEGQPRPRETDTAVLYQWIETGANPFPETEKRPSISIEQVMSAIRDDLRKASSEDRGYLRYMTLHTISNNPELSDSDLRMQRAALSKAINSVSWKSRIVVPRAVDATQSVFAVDVRDLDWDRNQRWQELIRYYPYGVHYSSEAERPLYEIEQEIISLSGVDLPFVRGDWFIATATRPPLYHVLLDLPDNAISLEHQLGVTIQENFSSPAPERISRAGFERSGVSGQNRLLERSESKFGGYWKSYDFKADSPHNRLRILPLGPLNLFPPGEHPYPRQAFVHDGGEIIFSLPNGLSGYYLTDGENRRIDAGPIQVVSDPLKTSGTPEIVTGVSCMACHKHGMIKFHDVIRNYSAVFGDAERQVQRLFIDQRKMDELVDDDTRKYLGALDQAIGKFMRTGPEDKRSITDFPEPIGEVARQYRLGYLDLETIARELDLENGNQLLSKVGEKNLKKLGLGAVVSEDLSTGPSPDGKQLRKGVISRLEWESVSGISLMQEVSRAIQRTPIVPL